MTKLEMIAESILFAAGEPISVKSLSQALGLDKDQARGIMLNLSDKYRQEKRGIQIIVIGDSFQMCTNPDYFAYIQALYQNQKEKTLTPAVLETLAIIAYKQPVTKPGIEEIRGVDASHAVNKLVEYGLVEEKGRSEAVGKPILFGTTDLFLKHFGFAALDTLPRSGKEME